MRDKVLNANLMSVRYDGNQVKLRNIKIRGVGTYTRIFDIRYVQALMIFSNNDDGPFYLTPEEEICKKYDQFSGVKKMMEIIKKN